MEDRSHEYTRQFKKQLQEVEENASESLSEYPDMSPEGRRECREHLDKTVETLLKIQKELLDADKAGSDPDARVVQVLGLNGRVVLSSDFRYSFEAASGKLRWSPSRFNLDTEYNYEMDKDLKLKPGEKQRFLVFSNVKDARHALGLKEFTLIIKDGTGSTGIPVQFVKPAQNSATRETLRKIGGLVDRIKEIDDELKSIGAVREYGDGVPTVSSTTHLDKKWFAMNMPEWERKRAAGLSLDRNAYVPLKWRKPVDSAKLQAKMKALYDEECDALMQLRKFQLDGIEFDF
jgi:hypothetical protein